MNKLKNENENRFPCVEITTHKEMLTFNEGLVYLNVSKSFLYKLTSRRRITFTKPNGGKIYFKKQDLFNWMLKNERKSVDVLEEQILIKIGKNEK